MANTNTVGFGLRSTMTVGNTPATQGQSEQILVYLLVYSMEHFMLTLLENRHGQTQLLLQL